MEWKGSEITIYLIIMPKKKLSPKKAYHNKCKEDQKVLREERKKQKKSQAELEWENGFNPDGSFDVDRYYWLNIRRDE